MQFINFNDTVESADGTGVESRIGASLMSSAVSKYDGLDDQRDDDTAAKNTFVRLLHYERIPIKRGMEGSKSNGHSAPETIAPIDVESPVSQQGLIALRLLHDALDYAQQLGRSRWEFAEEIDGLRQHGLANGDLRWLVCNGFVEHGREITELGEEGRKFRPDRGLCFSSETCFVLTEHGASHVSRWMNAPADDSDDEPSGLPTPSRDPDLQELRVGRPSSSDSKFRLAIKKRFWPHFKKRAGQSSLTIRFHRTRRLIPNVVCTIPSIP